MYNGMKVYRGVVSYSGNDGVYAYVPALVGSDIPVKISDIIVTPSVQIGQQVLVAVEDDKAYNVHIISGSPEVDGGSA
jgi:Fe-S cluster assembly scaffold protein SufB